MLTSNHPPFQYSIVGSRDGDETLTVFLPSGPVTLRQDHPHYVTVRGDVTSGAASQLREDEIIDLADLSTAVARRFDKLSERVSVANGRVYFDGDEIDGSITRLIVRALDAGLGTSWRPLVRFLENVAGNPQQHSREQLFDWLNARAFTITPAGEVVAYKGVERRDDGGYQSIWAGGAIVNGERVEGQVPQRPGDVVELPRSQVAFDPSEACSVGLHVGTYDYAQHYSRNGAMLKVVVNPRDVVSVPTDADGEKVRVCRYAVADTISDPLPESAWIDLNEADDGECECGDELDARDYCPSCDY
jgi:hypothetical protein